MNTKELDNAYIANTYARFPIEIVGGEGSIVYDEKGKEYIDLGGGIAVNIFGIKDKAWIEAVTAQLNKFQHTSNLYYSAPCAILAEKLCSLTGGKKVFFSNSGAEANECAIKIARLYAAKTKGDDCYKIITLQNSFHGRTITTLAATGQEVFHKDFQPLTSGFLFSKANDFEQMKSLIENNKIAAVLMEAVQGEGGVVPLDADFVKKTAELCKQKDILLMFDEVQIGNGRSGKLCGYMNFGVTPDVFTTAKGLGGGLPLGATVLFDKVKDLFSPGTHGSTFGGNPVACAGAISIIDRLDQKTLLGVQERSQYIIDALKGKKGIKSVSGMGLMLGIETEKDAGAVINECLRRGVMPIKAKNKVRLLPALNIPFELLKKAIETIIEVCAE